jgi:hypothetical protein
LHETLSRIGGERFKTRPPSVVTVHETQSCGVFELVKAATHTPSGMVVPSCWLRVISAASHM